MATEMAAEVEQLKQKVAVLEALMSSSKITGPDGTGERSLGKTVLDMEIYVSTLISDPPPPTTQRKRNRRCKDERKCGGTH